MQDEVSERRLAENEVVFRAKNERVQQGFDSLEQVAQESGQKYYPAMDDHHLSFFCECSNENCRQRVSMRPSEYNEIHTNRARFSIIPGHEVEEIEFIVRTNDIYNVVEKYKTPPQTADHLNATS